LFKERREARFMNQEFLREAIRLSIEKSQAGEGGPFGAVVVRDGRIVGRGWNRVTSTSDPTAHAELVAIRDACSRLGTFSLAGCEIYTSCEPCPMCLAAIYWSRLERIYYAASCEDAAAADFDDGAFYRQLALPADSRAVPMVQDLRDEAREAFRLWLLKADRTRY
jgi:guanine deaminase